jgi:hypothetical protein
MAEKEKNTKTTTVDGFTAKQANRYNAGKPQYSLVDFKSLEDMVRVLEFGAQKYSRHNWKNGLYASSILDSLLRHVAALIGGQFLDPESGLPHHGHIQCNAMFLEYILKNKPEFVDIPFTDVESLIKYYAGEN